jgi:hypothetical protein
VAAHTWSASQWLAALNIADVIAGALVPFGTGDELAAVRGLAADATSASLRRRLEVRLDALVELLLPALHSLAMDEPTTGDELQMKFVQALRRPNPFSTLPSPSLPTSSHPSFTSLPFQSLSYPSLPYPSLPFPTLPFSFLHFPSLHFPSLFFPSPPFPLLPITSHPIPSRPASSFSPVCYTRSDRTAISHLFGCRKALACCYYYYYCCYCLFGCRKALAC